MKLIFCGHNFKYEIEAVMKLFLPVESFNFLSCPTPRSIPDVDGDHCVLIRETYSGIAQISTECEIGGRSAKSQEKIPVVDKDYEHRCEIALCRQMFSCLRELTGITPAWGVLTGVRPVKLISRLLAAGMSESELFRHMEKSLYVSPEKIRLGIETAKNQKTALSNIPKNSFSLYVSIPFCPSRCAYCSFVSQTVASFFKLIPEYIDRLCEEIEYTASIVGNLGLTLDTIYFGGGTPTSLEPEQLQKIMSTIARSFDLSSLREYTIEAGRPDTVTREKLLTILNNGCDRISVNPQTMHDNVLEAIGRRHTVAQFLDAYDLARNVGFKSVNIDIIAGLPKDTIEGFMDTVERVCALDPENITVHTLSIKRAADLMRHPDTVARTGETVSMVNYSRERLDAKGYKPYYLYRQKNQLGNLENVGWERGGTPGIYNINMMEEVQTILAVGAGASTKIVAGERKIERLYNPKYPAEYLKNFDNTVVQRKKTAAEKIEQILKDGDIIDIHV